MDQRLEKEYESRIKKTRLEAAKRGYDALLVFSLAPRRVGDTLYLVGHQPMMPGHPRRYGFRGRGYSVLILPVDTRKEPRLITSTPFYERDLFVQDVIYHDDVPFEIGRAITQFGLERSDIGIVGMDIVSVDMFEDLKHEAVHARFHAAGDIVMNLRAMKSPYEIELLRTGAEIGDEVAMLLIEFLKPGLREREVYQFITAELTKRGVTGAFATCQSGWRSETAYDLVPASDKVIEDGDMVHMEINGKYQGYMIDICRSTVVGTASQRQIYILETCLEMFEKSVAAMRPDVLSEDLEKISGEIALERGFTCNHTRAFGGPATYLGHAIGLGTDEPPVVAQKDKTPLMPGMVITIEPGLYQTGVGGCRIEDEILVTETGYENLNHSEKRWW